ncbi:MAG TPA: porin PorA family protein [Streptosporangiaceae bacterium]|nr:porin PorA family protein [Streptosporangiaceae bacterium]
MRKAAIASGAIGLILLLAAALLAWWITPAFIARTPSDYNKTRTYTGTIRSLVVPSALATGNLAAAVKTGLPATLTDHVKVLQTSGNTGQYQDTRTITAAGSPVSKTINNYALDRSTLMATRSHPSNWSVTPATGLVVSWPLGAKKQNYTGWVPLTHTTTPLKYVKQQTQGGINTYEYQAIVRPTVITETQVTGHLPKALPTALLARISAAGLIPAADIAALGRAFPGATAIPVKYTYQATNTYWVDPNTGLVINLSNNEVETGNIALPNGTLIPIFPILSDTYHASPGSVTQAVNDAKDGSTTISTWGVTVPIICLCVGFVLVVAAVLLWLFGRSRGRPVDIGERQRHPSPAGTIR